MAVTPPEGTVTFLFTDLEGSTELWERRPDDMRRAVADHDGLLREVFERHGGYVFTTAGDSFAVAFALADGAVAAAEAVQREMGRTRFDGVGTLLVRIGLHTGTAELRDGDYFGPDVNLAARIMSAGHGGQVLLTGSTLALAPSITTVDLGRHHLKGIRDNRRIHQLTAPELATEFPPLRTASAPTTNLPESRVSLVGREFDASRVAKTLDDHRLVTLVGPGGVGKTSLALDVARSLIPDDGTWLVDLAPVSDEEYLPIAFADAVGLADSGSRSLEEQVVSHLRDLDAVLVVDNCEHVIDAAAAMLEQILSRAPRARILATSREVLDLPDEAVVPVSPLGLPGSDATRDEVLAAPALRLLDARAASAGPGLDPLGEDLDASVEVCRLVDGLPLAIELAAARLRTMSVAELAVELRERFSILAAGRGRQARHRTLEAVIDWSYHLLDDEERRTFEHLSVFAGGFTAAAAADVLPDGLGRIDVLLRLVDKSLALGEATEDGTRYRILETLRSFAADRLGERGETDSARDAHLAWCLTVIARLETDMRTPRQDESLRSARPEHDNLRAARAWAESHDPVTTLRITTSAPIDTHTSRRDRLIDEVERATEASSDLRARARYAALGASFEAGDFAAGIRQGREAMRLYDELGDASQRAYTRMMLAFCLWGSGEHDDVGDHLRAALTAFEELDDPMGRAYLDWCVSQWCLQEGTADEATTDQARRAVEGFTSIDSPFGAAHAVEGVGHLLAREGRLDEAMVEMVDAVHRLHAIGHTGCLAHALDGVAVVLVLGGRLVEGGEMVGAAERLRVDSGASQRPWEIDATARCVADLRAGLDPDELDQALAQGRALDIHEILDRVGRHATWPPTG